MKKENEIQRGKILSMMSRIESPTHSINESLRNERAIINEATAAGRIRLGSGEILDKLNELYIQSKEGKTPRPFISMTYVKPVNFVKMKSKWRTEDVTSTLANYSREGNEHWFDTVNDYNNNPKGKLGFNSIIVTQRYLLNYINKDDLKRKSSEFADKRNNLRMSFGVGLDSNGLLGDNHNQREELSTGEMFTQRGNLMLDLETTKKKIDATNYVIGADGSVVGVIPNDITKSITNLGSTGSVEKDVREALADNPEKLQEYIDAKQELDRSFKQQTFKFDNILSIVFTVNGQGYYFINNALMVEISKGSGVYVSGDAMMKIAEKALDADEQAVEEYRNKNVEGESLL